MKHFNMQRFYQCINFKYLQLSSIRKKSFKHKGQLLMQNRGGGVENITIDSIRGLMCSSSKGTDGNLLPDKRGLKFQKEGSSVSADKHQTFRKDSK